MRLHLLLILCCLLSMPALGLQDNKPKGLFLTVEEALELAFPKAVIKRGSVYLSKEELQGLNKLSGDKLGRGILHPYRAYAPPAKDGGPPGRLLGTAWFDTHKVRTLRETIMVVIDPAGKVKRIEILAFAEPKSYLPKAKWCAQFLGRDLGPGLKLARDIRGISGASMSCRAVTGAVRRCLASHQVSAEQEARFARKASAKKAKKAKQGSSK